ncbi:hypothetical protein ILUMI_11564 [Ignelater luminosus]|uniref:Uncharacterized protein n=1 Tax=Ignelater luminosus TaxID=2038154 RepID=A0A8K0GDT4_IGNLU|nr:hypothetical protein ILUMI_11564 [Ignelater luminosus]
MIGSKLIIIISIVFVINLKITRSKKHWCKNTEEIATNECNSCFCIKGIPVCTRIDCSKVPKEQWTSLLARKRPNRSMFFKMFIVDFIMNGLFCMVEPCEDTPENNNY